MAEATMLAVRGIDASYYMTKDLAVAIEFYNGLFGMEPATTVPDMFCEYVFPDGNAFGLYKSDSFYPGGTVMFAVDDVAEFVKTATARGITFNAGGHIEETPVCKMAFAADPDGNQFMVHKVK